MKTTTISMIMVLGILCSSNHVLASDLSNLQSNSSIACIFAPPILHDAAKLIPGGSFGDGESTEAKATASIMQIRRLQFTAQDGSNGTPVTLDSIRLIGVSISLDTLLVGTTELLLDVTTGMDAVLKEGDFNVSTNYPNPFGSQTQFEVFSPSSSPVTINLYAPNGKRITTFQSSLVHGVSRFVLHGASMPAGIYMLEVIGGKGQRKLTRLMKTASSGTGSVRIESVGSTTDLNPTMGKISAMLSLQVTGYADGYKEQTHTVQVESDTTISFTLYADIPVPPAPSNLTAEAVSSSQINLVWQDNSDNEQMFKIGRRAPSGTRDPGGAVHYTEIGTVSQNVTSYQDLGLTANKSYSYIVIANNPQAGDSEESNMATVSTYADIPVPAAPTKLKLLTSSTSSIHLLWFDKSDNEDGFLIERAPGGTSNFTQIADIPKLGRGYTNTGLASSTSYSYRVRAYNAGGNSAYSNIATETTMPGGVPAAPTHLTATAVSTYQIDLSWQDNSDNESRFEIRRTLSGTTDWEVIKSLGKNETSYQDKNDGSNDLEASTSYSYVVIAANNEGASGSSNLVIATTHAEPPVGLDIRGPSTAYGLFQVSVTYDKWPTTASRNDSYYLEESTTSSRWGFTEIQKSPSPTRTSPYFFNIQRDPGTYHYRARVFVGAGPNPGYTDYSDVITVVSQAQPNAILRIVNQSRYALVDIRLNGIQMVEQDEGLSVGRSKEYDFRNSRTVDFIVGRGNWSLGAREIMLPFDSGSVEVVAGETREMLVVKTSIIQLFTNGQPYQDWEGDYRDEASVKHTLVFRFTGDGRWSFFADGEAMGSGIVTLDSWDDYATNAKFKLGDNRIGIFSIIADGFIYPNGPPNDPKVSYFRQN
jgi:Fibronectin type III domain